MFNTKDMSMWQFLTGSCPHLHCIYNEDNGYCTEHFKNVSMDSLMDYFLRKTREYPYIQEALSQDNHECVNFKCIDGYCPECGIILEQVCEESGYGFILPTTICPRCD